MADNVRGFSNPRIAVKAIHEALLDDETYRRFIVADRDEDAVEGSIFVDDFMAAKMIRERAAELGSPVARLKLATICDALDSILPNGAIRREAHRKANEAAQSERVKRFLGVPPEEEGDD
jgi:hypothetical protein